VDNVEHTKRGSPNAPSSAPLEEHFAELYEDLRAAAVRVMRRERPGHTLRPTAVVHEAYLRFAGQDHFGWSDRTAFLGVAASVMRRVLVDHVRSKRAEKRGADPVKVTLSDGVLGTTESLVDLIALEEGLRKLTELDPRQTRVVELRFFGGLSVAETAEVLMISPATVKRDWVFAKAFLFRLLQTSA